MLPNVFYILAVVLFGYVAALVGFGMWLAYCLIIARWQGNAADAADIISATGRWFPGLRRVRRNRPAQATGTHEPPRDPGALERRPTPPT